MSSANKARLAFGLALGLLLLGGIATAVTIAMLVSSARWVAHTYEVKTALGEVNSSVSSAARARFDYVHSGDPGYLPQYESLKQEIRAHLEHVRDLTRDNPSQQLLAGRLNDFAEQRLALLDASVELQRSGQTDPGAQDRFTLAGVDSAASLATIQQQMQNQEQILLDRRSAASGGLLWAVLSILFAVFTLSAVLFWVHYRLLRAEVLNREQLETNARRLSVRLLNVQDEERRKFSRELHDSVGQLLTLAKMNLAVLLEMNPADKILAETEKVLDEALAETRTVSYLLHPPLLDELGIASAVKWYLDGFGQRSGIQLSVDIADSFGRLSQPTELVLFRALQESLTNVHRHSKSSKADVSLRTAGDKIVLRVRDYGKGMPRGTLENFLGTGADSGVGLAGMRERIREQSGQFEIQSDENGTLVEVILPISVPPEVHEQPATLSS
ncbi:MAG TPA: CHASE3 domain-containing protein [Candidatus Acidoferrales bacterium]